MMDGIDALENATQQRRAAVYAQRGLANGPAYGHQT